MFEGGYTPAEEEILDRSVIEEFILGKSRCQSQILARERVYNEALTIKLQEVTKKHEDLEDSVNNHRDEIYTLKNQLLICQAATNNSDKDKHQLENTIEKLKEELSKKDKCIAQYDETMQQLCDAVNHRNTIIQDMNTKMDQLSNEVEAKDKSIESLEKTISDLGKEKHDNIKLLNKKDNDIEVLKGTIEESKNESSEIISGNKRLETLIEIIKIDLSRVKTERDDIRGEYAKVKTRCVEIEAEYNDVNEKYQNMAAGTDSKMMEVKEMLKKIEESQVRIDKDRKEMDLMNIDIINDRNNINMKIEENMTQMETIKKMKNDLEEGRSEIRKLREDMSLKIAENNTYRNELDNEKQVVNRLKESVENEKIINCNEKILIEKLKKEANDNLQDFAIKENTLRQDIDMKTEENTKIKADNTQLLKAQTELKNTNNELMENNRKQREETELQIKAAELREDEINKLKEKFEEIDSKYMALHKKHEMVVSECAQLSNVVASGNAALLKENNELRDINGKLKNDNDTIKEALEFEKEQCQSYKECVAISEKQLQQNKREAGEKATQIIKLQTQHKNRPEQAIKNEAFISIEGTHGNSDNFRSLPDSPIHESSPPIRTEPSSCSSIPPLAPLDDVSYENNKKHYANCSNATTSLETPPSSCLSPANSNCSKDITDESMPFVSLRGIRKFKSDGAKSSEWCTLMGFPVGHDSKEMMLKDDSNNDDASLVFDANRCLSVITENTARSTSPIKRTNTSLLRSRVTAKYNAPSRRNPPKKGTGKSSNDKGAIASLVSNRKLSIEGDETPGGSSVARSHQSSDTDIDVIGIDECDIGDEEEVAGTVATRVSQRQRGLFEKTAISQNMDVLEGAELSGASSGKSSKNVSIYGSESNSDDCEGSVTYKPLKPSEAETTFDKDDDSGGSGSNNCGRNASSRRVRIQVVNALSSHIELNKLPPKRKQSAHSDVILDMSISPDAEKSKKEVISAVEISSHKRAKIDNDSSDSDDRSGKDDDSKVSDASDKDDSFSKTSKPFIVKDAASHFQTSGRYNMRNRNK